MTTPKASKYTVRLDDLERAVHLSPDDLVEERPEQDAPHEPAQLDPALRWAFPI